MTPYQDRAFLLDWWATENHKRKPTYPELHAKVGAALKDNGTSAKSLKTLAEQVCQPETAKRKMGRKTTAERDAEIAEEFAQGKRDEEWVGQAEYLRQRHPVRWKKNRRAASAWLSTLLKRAQSKTVKKSRHV